MTLTVHAADLTTSEPSIDELDGLAPYPPIVAWPLFPDDKIFGYKKLRIICLFSATSLHPFLHVSYDAVINDDSSLSEYEPHDISGAFKARFDECGLELACTWSAFVHLCTQGDREFVPPGEVWHEFSVKKHFADVGGNGEVSGAPSNHGKRKRSTPGDSRHPKKKGPGAASDAADTMEGMADYDEANHEAVINESEGSNEVDSFEVYKLPLSDPVCLNYYRRIRLFLLFYIDGAQYIDDSDLRWEVYCVFHSTPNPNSPTNPYRSFAGFATCYPYRYPKLDWQYEELGNDEVLGLRAVSSKEVNWRTRERISQILVLPPWQGKSVGSSLYRSLYNAYFGMEEVAEIAIEEPNDTMMDLRDHCDYGLLRSQNAFSRLSVDLFWNGSTVKGTITSKKAVQVLPADYDGASSDDVSAATNNGSVGLLLDRSVDGVVTCTTTDVERKVFDVEVERLATRWKVTKQQALRLTELHLYLNLPRPKLQSDPATRAYRLMVKRRIYLKNRDVLADMPVWERTQKVREAYDGVLEDYQDIARRAGILDRRK
ncbi:histone acetyltransferase 1 [Gonapodya sp. JEL0774]|nr:histone acetyltransferase 1 [Gonapodya sp. JEL0774]